MGPVARRKYSLPEFCFRLILFTCLFFLILNTTHIWLRPLPPLVARLLRSETLGPGFDQLKVLHRPQPPAPEGAWRRDHLELGQSFRSFRHQNPTQPRDSEPKLLLRLLGEDSPVSQRIFSVLAEFLGHYYCSTVQVLPPLTTQDITGAGQRYRNDLGLIQYRTTDILALLSARDSASEFLVSAVLTDRDLWPGRGWNFVFGQADQFGHNAVFSWQRLGSVQAAAALEPRFLQTLFQVSAHEVGHALGIKHCITYHCLMNGSNSLEEAEQQPLEACPVCLKKIAWRTGCQPKQRFEALASFYRKYGLEAEAAAAQQAALLFGTDSAAAVTPRAPASPSSPGEP